MESEIEPLTALGIALVMFVCIGFLLFLTGVSQRKNAANTFTNGMIAGAFSVFGFFVFGKAVMFSSLGEFHLKFPIDPSELMLLLHCAGIAALFAIISTGAGMGRLKTGGVAIFSFLVGAGIFPVAGRWLGEDPNLSLLMGIAVGTSALAVVVVSGKRAGRFHPGNGAPLLLPAHHIPFTLLGTLFIAAGWIGFHLIQQEVVRLGPCLNFVIGAVSASMSAGLIYRWRFGAFSPLSVSFGIAGGLVAMLAAADSVSAGFAILIGFVAGVSVIVSQLILEKCRLDDPANLISIHLVCGIIGVAATVILESADSFQPAKLIPVAVCFGAGLASCFLLLFLKSCNLLVADETSQRIGLDLTTHGTNSYPES